MEFSNVYWQIQDAYTAHRGQGKHYIVLQGGTYAGKTWGVVQFLYQLALVKEGLRSRCISESFPHMRTGAMDDFFRMLKTEEPQSLYFEDQHNKTEHSYQLNDGYIQFLGCDSPTKVTGPRQDISYFNELPNIPYSVFDEADTRTELLTIVDYNPHEEFWIVDKLVEWGDRCTFIKCTYKDSLPFLPQGKRDEIERWRLTNPNKWKVHGEAEWGNLEGRIYDFGILDQVPDEAELLPYGVDTGYSNDPTAVCALYRWNGGIICDQLFYKTGMMPEDVWAEIKDEVHQSVDGYADPANPVYIEGFKRAGWRRLKPATKGKESVKAGIQIVQDNPLWFTRRSVDYIREARNYAWKVDKMGVATNEPEDGNAHGMDSLRYPLQTIFTKPKRVLYLAD